MTRRSDTGPFAIIPEWVLEADVSDGAIRQYAILARHADNGTGDCWPSRAELAERQHCSVDTVDRRNKELTGLGALTITHRRDEAGDRTSNLYTVHRVRLGGREAAATGSDWDAATGGREAAAGTRPILELEPLELEIAPATRPRHRDAIWDAFVACWDLRGDEMTETERGRLNKAVGQLRRVGADPDEIPARRAMYAILFPDAAQTPLALVGRWAECRPDPTRIPARAGRQTGTIARAAARAER